MQISKQLKKLVIVGRSVSIMATSLKNSLFLSQKSFRRKVSTGKCHFIINLVYTGFQLELPNNIFSQFSWKFRLGSFCRMLVSGRGAIRVFDETLFWIFAKHETRENAPVFRETFANFATFARSNFAIFVFRESCNFRETREIWLIKHNKIRQGF